MVDYTTQFQSSVRGFGRFAQERTNTAAYFSVPPAFWQTADQELSNRVDAYNFHHNPCRQGAIQLPNQIHTPATAPENQASIPRGYPWAGCAQTDGIAENSSTGFDIQLYHPYQSSQIHNNYPTTIRPSAQSIVPTPPWAVHPLIPVQAQYDFLPTASSYQPHSAPTPPPPPCLPVRARPRRSSFRMPLSPAQPSASYAARLTASMPSPPSHTASAATGRRGNGDTLNGWEAT
jgi:hypothetical protein